MSQALLKAIANYSVQGEGPAPTDATYHLHRTDGIGPHQLHQNGSHHSNRQEARSAERVGGRGSLHPLCAGICHQKPYGEDNGPGVVQQLLLCVWFSPTSHVGSRNRILWEGHCGYVQPAQCRKDPYNPVSSSDQWIG